MPFNFFKRHFPNINAYELLGVELVKQSNPVYGTRVAAAQAEANEVKSRLNKATKELNEKVEYLKKLRNQKDFEVQNKQKAFKYFKKWFPEVIDLLPDVEKAIMEKQSVNDTNFAATEAQVEKLKNKVAGISAELNEKNAVITKIQQQ